MLPNKTDPRWRRLVVGEMRPTVSALATKFMLSRVNQAASRDASPSNLSKLVDEAYEFFIKNERVVANDIRAIFNS